VQSGGTPGGICAIGRDTGRFYPVVLDEWENAHRFDHSKWQNNKRRPETSVVVFWSLFFSILLSVLHFCTSQAKSFLENWTTVNPNSAPGALLFQMRSGVGHLVGGGLY